MAADAGALETAATHEAPHGGGRSQSSRDLGYDWSMRARSLPPTIVAALWLLALAGCPPAEPSATPPSTPEAKPSVWPPKCAEGTIWLYTEPGCGGPRGQPSGACVDAPPCVEDFCSCDHTTVSGCGGATEAWVSRGACAPR